MHCSSCRGFAVSAHLSFHPIHGAVATLTIYDRQRLPLILSLDEVCDETMRSSSLPNTIHFTTMPTSLAVNEKAQVPPSIGHLDQLGSANCDCLPPDQFPAQSRIEATSRISLKHPYDRTCQPIPQQLPGQLSHHCPAATALLRFRCDINCPDLSVEPRHRFAQPTT